MLGYFGGGGVAYIPPIGAQLGDEAVIEGDKSGNVVTTLAGVVSTGFSVTITPSNLSDIVELVLDASVIADRAGASSTNDRRAALRVYRNTTALAGALVLDGASVDSMRVLGRRLISASSASAITHTAGTFLFRDAPATVAPTTYTVAIWSTVAGDGTKESTFENNASRWPRLVARRIRGA